MSVVAVGLVTGAVYALRPIAPILSLGVLYVIAVVVVAVLFGLTYALPVSVASMLVFNFLFLPPVHTFRLAESENWIALGVYIATGVVVSELATRARRLAQREVEAETLRRADLAKTAVLRAVSHDLRSPLTAIRAAAETLSSSAFELPAADRRDLLDAILREVHRLERLVDNLLDLSRLDAGPAIRRPELWPVELLVSRSLQHLEDDADRVVVAVDPEVEPVYVDGAHAERVLVNLLENALRFSSPVDQVEVTAGRSRRGVEIRVRDRGPGVPAEDRDRIFEAFERGAGNPYGTGLGLAIARGFAEVNGGRVWVDSGGETGGSIFVVELPAAAETAAVAP